MVVKKYQFAHSATEDRSCRYFVWEFPGSRCNHAERSHQSVQRFLWFDTVGVPVFVKEGDSVTLKTDIEIDQQEDIIRDYLHITWRFHNTDIAIIRRIQDSFICTDVQCNEDTERFRDRLKLDHQTGSLTINNIRNTDSGVYELKIISRSIREKNFIVTVHGFLGVGADRDSVFVMEGDSVSLQTGFKTSQLQEIRWYFNDIRLAQITEDQSKICTDDQCDEIFRDRLKLDHQTGSLTIMNTRITDSGLYHLEIFSINSIISNSSSGNINTFSVSVHGVSAAEREEMKIKSVKEGESVTLYCGVTKNLNDVMAWYFNEILIAGISGNPIKTCTDVQCNEGNESFRDRLKLDHQTGSLTIMNTRNTDSGEYQLRFNSIRGITFMRSFSVSVTGFFSIGSDGVSSFVMEGDSVTLNTGVETLQQEKITWYFNDIPMAQITGYLSFICTDVHVERFRDRLKLDHQTGSLTIMNITITDSGEYKFQINNSTKIFRVSVHGVSTDEQDKMKRKSVKEGESVTVPCVTKNPNDTLRWYFNEILITEIIGDQSKICIDDQCDERFTDRLKLDHQTGSLTIMNTRITDSGEYQLQFNRSSFNFIRSFSVSVTVDLSCSFSSRSSKNPPDATIYLFHQSVPDSGLSSKAGIGAVVLLLLLVAAVICYRKARQNDIRGKAH